MIVFVCWFASFSSPSFASSCSASNESGDTCSIDCQSGQSAVCTNATGNSQPICKCEGTPTGVDGLMMHIKSFSSGIVNQTPLKIEKTNALDTINLKLASERDYKLPNGCRMVDQGKRTCRAEHNDTVCILNNNNGFRKVGFCGPRISVVCDVVEKEQVCDVEVKGKLKVISISLDKEPVVKVEEPNWSSIPDRFIGRELDYVNCSNEKQSQKYGVNEEVSVGEKVQMTKSIEDSSGEEISANVQYSPPGSTGGVGGNVGKKSSFSHKINVTSLNEQDFQQKRAISENTEITLAPNSVTHVSMKAKVSEAPIKFTGKAVFDGIISDNQESIKKLSDIYPKKSDRTIEFSGLIYSTILYNTVIDNQARPPSPGECVGK